MYKRLLVPVDGSDLTDRAIHASIQFAAQLGAAITGYVAEPLPAMPVGARSKSLLEQDLKEHDAMTAAHAKPLLARFEAAAKSAGVAFTGVFEQVPLIDDAIVKAAESHGCDMIVMVTHGRGRFGEFLFGSHTKAVLAGSKLPLLVLH
jgi:nucleotide-binding universal stress UspA family protein